MLACIKKKLVLGLPAFFAPHLLANNTINGSYTQPFALCSLSQGTYPFVVCCGVLQSHKYCHLSLFFNSWNNSSQKIMFEFISESRKISFWESLVYRWPSGLERSVFYDCCGATKNFPSSNPFATNEKEILPSTKAK